MAINPSASQTLSLNMKLLSNHDLGGFGGIGEGILPLSIAYAGTRATGEAARWFYRTGTPMDPAEKRRVYEAALERGEIDTVLQDLKLVGQIPVYAHKEG